ncbi:MAG TPA: ATP-dependent helicase, partial [Humisphaera sp.]|nr:ATP-dependent helicase [Humisphaera sp.]
MDASYLDKLNDQQRAAATFGDFPLLIIAGAGTGKTNTLAHRVAHLISTGVNPARILLLTFTRRASAEMLKRVGSILASTSATKAAPAAMAARVWGGTFHATANRLLRIYARQLGLGENFTVADRSDAEDLLNDVRGEIGLDAGDVRFPRKGTALAIYSRCVNASEPVELVLKSHFPWCASYPDQLKNLFRAYTQRKQEQAVLDYDDLLLYWFHLMEDPALAADVRARFDAVLVDEYQDTNALQANTLKRLSPEGNGLSVVGDDAQSIYSFRAATVHNILDFPKVWPGATVIKLEQNYRSVQPILDATNSVIALCPNRYSKDLFSQRRSAQKPKLVTLVDEDQQSDYVIRRCLEHLEAGIPLSRQAVLFRTAHHSDALEVELARRNIPFVKYGGLKFLEAAHVKDVLSILRLAENPRDSISAFRVLQLLDGVGPAHARRAIAHLASRRFDLHAWESFSPPPAAEQQWGEFVAMLIKVSPNNLPLPEQVAEVKRFYTPILDKRYDQALIRRRDLEQLEQISSNFNSRSVMLTDLALDPPSATQDLAGPPLREEDFLILSTIHSAKGCEWDAVYVIHAADGNIPSDMATGSEEEIEEERRLFYVALTRAKDFLEVCVPLRYYQKKHATGDRHTYAQPSRFLPDQILHHFERVSMEPKKPVDLGSTAIGAGDIR